MARQTLEDLLDDLNDLIEGERENEYGESEYLYDGEWLSEDEFIDSLIEEDHITIASASGFISGDDLNEDLHFPYSEFYDDEDDDE